jgi:CheY-like chemotaxis protein
VNPDNLTVLLLLVSAVLFGLVILLIGLLLRKRKPVAVEASSSRDVPVVAPEPARAVVAPPQMAPASNALFATLSHELRTPLNGLLGVAQIMQEERPSEDGVAIEGCARHMLAVIGALVNLSKIQTEGADLQEYREWVNFYDLMEQVKKDLVFRADLRGLTITLNHQDSKLRLRGDGDHLRVIVENALLGSIESVSLAEVPEEKAVLDVTWRTEGEFVKVEITNPREEVSETRQQNIEEVFRMTTGVNHERMKMEYLYWAVSSAMLGRYNGTMTATPNAGGGVNTLLSFEMEQMKASASGKLPVGGLRLDQGGKSPKAMLALPVKLSLIVAEDDPIARRLMASILARMKQEVVFATNGREVIELIQESKGCDLVLMDIDMPIMDGMAAAQALRAGEGGDLGKQVPIVAVTAFSSLSDEGKFKKAGMNYFLPKPVKLNKLREVLLDVIREERYVDHS